jgi:hypothetical protein
MDWLVAEGMDGQLPLVGLGVAVRQVPGQVSRFAAPLLQPAENLQPLYAGRWPDLSKETPRTRAGRTSGLGVLSSKSTSP